MSTFTLEEVKSFAAKNGGGNVICRETWFGNLEDDDDAWPNEGDNLQTYKNFIERAFLNEEWYRKSGKSRGKKHKKEKKKKKKKAKDRHDDFDFRSESVPTTLSGSEDDDFGTMMDAADNANAEFDPFAGNGGGNNVVAGAGNGVDSFDLFSSGNGGASNGSTNDAVDPFDPFSNDASEQQSASAAGTFDEEIFSGNNSTVNEISGSSTKKKKKKKSKKKSKDREKDEEVDDMLGFDFGQASISTPPAAPSASSNTGGDDLLDFFGDASNGGNPSSSSSAMPQSTSTVDIMSQFSVTQNPQNMAMRSAGGASGRDYDPFAHLSGGGMPQRQQFQQSSTQQRQMMMMRQRQNQMMQQRRLNNPMMIHTGNQGTMGGGMMAQTMQPTAAPILPRQSSQTKATLPGMQTSSDQFSDLLNF